MVRPPIVCGNAIPYGMRIERGGGQSLIIRTTKENAYELGTVADPCAEIRATLNAMVMPNIGVFIGRGALAALGSVNPTELERRTMRFRTRNRRFVWAGDASCWRSYEQIPQPAQQKRSQYDKEHRADIPLNR